MRRHRIPAEQSDEFSSWDIPEVQPGQVLDVDKIAQRGPRGELLNVDKNEVIYNNITAAQLEKIANQAYEDVRDQAQKDGFQQGHAAGVAAGEQLVKQQVEQLAHTVQDLHSHLAGQDDEIEQSLINLVMSVSQSVLRRELQLDASHIQVIVNEAIATLPFNSANIIVHLNEQDKQLLDASGAIADDWQLQADPSISRGGCKVTTQHSIVDYTLEEQFQQTINQLVEKRYIELAERIDSEKNLQSTTNLTSSDPNSSNLEAKGSGEEE